MTEDLKLFEGNRIRHIYDEEKETYYFSVIDIIAILIEKDYQSARKYWKVLKGRLIITFFINLFCICKVAFELGYGFFTPSSVF